MTKLFAAILLGLLPAGAAVAQTAVRTGEVLRGDLASSDFVEVIAVIDDRELLQYSDCYVFQVEGRSWPQIDVASTDLDPDVAVTTAKTSTIKSPR